MGISSAFSGKHRGKTLARRKRHEHDETDPGLPDGCVPVDSADWSGSPAFGEGQPLSLTTPAAILAETSTGTIIFEKNADEKREVASITKLMTALLVFEALESGSVRLEDQVTVSPNAASMKGSQALLDAGAVYSLKDLLRTTIMASANDSAVALAEYIAGSEENFVRLIMYIIFGLYTKPAMSTAPAIPSRGSIPRPAMCVPFAARWRSTRTTTPIPPSGLTR